MITCHLTSKKKVAITIASTHHLVAITIAFAQYKSQNKLISNGRIMQDATEKLKERCAE
jgi:hypothetical protein